MLKMAGLCLLIVTPASALEPDEIAIIAVRRSARSRELAEYYAKRRDIPASHICLIDVQPGGDLDRNHWKLRVRPAIRRWIAANDLGGKLRCLVTTWDVPLKIGRESVISEERELFLQGMRNVQVKRLNAVADQVRELFSTGTAKPETIEDKAATSEIAKMLQIEFESAQRRILAEDDQAKSAGAKVELSKLYSRTAGVAGVLQQLAKETQKPSPGQASQRQQLLGRLIGLREGLMALMSVPESVSRDEQVLGIMLRSEGVLGCIRWIDQQLQLLKKNETYTSFDSELSLIYWPGYPLLRWIPNLHHHRFDGNEERDLRPVLMVSRLEAPTFELSKQLVDKAIETEQQGLNGGFYIDARGMAAPEGKEKPGSYSQYDESLRRLADLVKKHSQLKVTCDNQGGLFQPGDCPDTALYSGWYSLGKYVDAFKWKSGSVAYHIASSEAATLRNPASTVWCKRMLEEGVCATLGPVHEPYLAAFPLPEEFFALLLTGRYSLVETYYRTKPFNSWVMVLVGDPLYSPFARKPGLRKEDLPDHLKKLVE